MLVKYQMKKKKYTDAYDRYEGETDEKGECEGDGG